MRKIAMNYQVTLTEPLSDFLRSYIALNNMKIVYEPKFNTGLIFIETNLAYCDIIKLPYFTKVKRETTGELAYHLVGELQATTIVRPRIERETYGIGVINTNGIAVARNVTTNTDPLVLERLVIPVGTGGPYAI